uniref:Growth arrest and DNA damage-inducible protein GADD45 gamma n=1 Tax=Oryzias latipes TaxID=8090 RepID=A0A3B3HQ36_ORYLA
MVGGRSGKARPLPRNDAERFIKPPTACSDLRITPKRLTETHAHTALLRRESPNRAWNITMTLEEINGQENTMANADRVQSAGAALEELLLAAKKQDYLTVGVYESAKVMNVDPDSVAFCVLATDEEYECDIALQIHFTLIQAFCFDNDINVVRVNDIERLADLVGADETGEPKDVHCILVTSPSANPWKDPSLDKLSLFCEESRNAYDWVPTITLPER